MLFFFYYRWVFIQIQIFFSVFGACKVNIDFTIIFCMNNMCYIFVTFLLLEVFRWYIYIAIRTQVLFNINKVGVGEVSDSFRFFTWGESKREKKWKPNQLWQKCWRDVNIKLKSVILLTVLLRILKSKKKYK